MENNGRLGCAAFGALVCCNTKHTCVSAIDHRHNQGHAGPLDAMPERIPQRGDESADNRQQSALSFEWENAKFGISFNALKQKRPPFLPSAILLTRRQGSAEGVNRGQRRKIL